MTPGAGRRPIRCLRVDGIIVLLEIAIRVIAVILGALDVAEGL